MKFLSGHKRGSGRSMRTCRLETLEERRLLATIGNNIAVGSELQNYRIAISATAEYTAYFGGVAQAYQAIIDFVADANAILEKEFAIHLDLVSGTNVVFTNPTTDPFTNGEPGTLLAENQTTLDNNALMGSANYDIGHVFGTIPSGGSGIATLGVVGRSGWKARGSSSFSTPEGANWVSLAVHELAHQFGADHSFNGVVGNCGGQRSATNAYEPASGTTLMSYAGICGSDNIQSDEDDYFHAASFEQVQEYINSHSYSAPFSLTSLTNNPPTVNGGSNYTIPARSFFELQATGSDPDPNQTLTYTWEQLDLGPAQSLGSPDNGSSPLFRSYLPSTNPTRAFPQYENILAGTTPLGETLPTTTRSLNFRVTARDGADGLNSDDVLLNVIDTGSPFQLLTPNTAVSWQGGTSQTITWDVAGTSSNGINASNVDIYLSTDGGQTFPLLLTTTANDGSHTLNVPNIDTTQARLRIQGAGNVFFDISDTNFSIAANPSLPGVSFTETGNLTLVEEGGTYDTYQLALNTVPSSAVSIEIGADADLEVSLDGITFAATQTVSLNSTAPRTITVRAVNDTFEEGPETGAITHAIVSSGDSSYPLGLPLNVLSVEVVDDEIPPVVGIDFDYFAVANPPESAAPTNWARSTFYENQQNLTRDDGQPTPFDLTFVRSGGAGVTTASPDSGSIPYHIPSLAKLGGYTTASSQVVATYSGLAPGAEYGVYVFGVEKSSGDYVQTVSIVGGNSIPTYTQTLTTGILQVNDQTGSASRNLLSYEQVVKANSSGRIVITVAKTGSSPGISLAGLAIRELPVAPVIPTASVVNRHLFYNNSSFDGNTPAATPADSNAISGKLPLTNGQVANFTNYSSYVRGINGVMIDVDGLVNRAGVDAADFTFHQGGTNTPSTWSLAPSPTSVTVLPGAGENGSDRIVLIWADGTLVNTWLQITASAGGDLGLPSADTFYFGNAIGETGDSGSQTEVNATDFAGVRSNPHNFITPATVSNAYDLNRDARVDVSDLLIVRDNAMSGGAALPLIDLSSVSMQTQVIASVPDQVAILSDPEPTSSATTQPDSITQEVLDYRPDPRDEDFSAILNQWDRDRRERHRTPESHHHRSAAIDKFWADGGRWWEM